MQFFKNIICYICNMEKVLKLYTYIDGENDKPFPNSENQIEIFDFTYDAKRMGGAPSISCSLMYKDCLDDVWTEQVYATFNGEKYFLKYTPTSSYSNKDARYKHEIELVSERIILDNVYFYDVVSENQNDYKPITNSDKFSFFGNIREFVSRLNSSLKKSEIDYVVKVDNDITSEEKLISFEKSFFSNALQEIYNTYKLPYYFVGEEIHVGYTENVILKTFKYGIDDALLSITKTNSNNKVVNRITGVGSSENIPYYYPNDTEKGGITAVAISGIDTSDIEIVDSELYAKKIAMTVDSNNILPSSILTYQNAAGEVTKSEIWHEKKHIIPEGQDYIVSHVGYTPIYIYARVYFTLKSSGDFAIRPRLFVDNELKSITSEVSGIYNKVGSEVGYNIFVEDGFFRIKNAEAGEYIAIFTYNLYRSENSRGFYNIYINSTETENISSWVCGNQTYKLREVGIKIDVDVPYGASFYQLKSKDYIEPQTSLMPPIYRESSGAKRFYDAINNTYTNEETNEYYQFDNPYIQGKPKEHIENFEDIKPTIKEMMVDGYRIDMFSEFAYDLNDNDEKIESEDGSQLEYKHPYFFGKLRKLGFNLFDSAIENGEMTISMTSGHCGACKFVIGVDSNTQKNIVQVDENGNLLRDENGDVRCGREGKPKESPQDIQNDTTNNEVWIALRKDIETFNTIMPNAVSKPSVEDTFVILNILLPKSYILAAEKKLEDALIKYMYENNEEKFNFSINFSRIFLEENKDILAELNENARIQIEYNGKEYELYISSYSYKMSPNQSLPEIRVDLSDELNVSQNAIQNAISAVKADILDNIGSIDILKLGLAHFIRKDVDDFVNGILRYNKGLEVGKYTSGAFGTGGSFNVDEQGNSHIEADYITIRKKATFNEITIQELKHIGGQLILSPAAMVCSSVEDREDGYYCYFASQNDDGIEIHNEFVVGDQARSQSFNTINDNRYYWRLVTKIGRNYIVLSKDDCDYGSTFPKVGDNIVQLGNRSVKERQNAQIISAYGDGSPSITQYVGVNSFSLYGKEQTRISPNNNIFTGRVNIQPNSTGIGNFKDLPEELQKSVEIGGNNILRNSGFVGNYESEYISSNDNLESNSEMYSSSIEFWEGDLTIIDEPLSVSGLAADFSSLKQKVTLIQDESYVVTFYAKAIDTIVFNCAGFTHVFVANTSEYKKCSIKFVAKESETIFSLESTRANIYDLKLERGTIATDWTPSILDNDKVAQEFKKYQYIYNAIKDGNTDIIGGLILSSMLQLGKYKDGVLESVTAGVNGGYYNDDSVAFWAGGTLEQAIRTVAKFSSGQQPTEEDWMQMANFVATHGGDVFMRGYLNALGVALRGKIETVIGDNKLIIDPENNVISAYNNDEIVFSIDYKASRIAFKGIDCSDGLTCTLREFDLSAEGLSFKNNAIYGAMGFNAQDGVMESSTIKDCEITNKLKSNRYTLPQTTPDGLEKEWKLYVDDNGIVRAVY